MPGPGGHERQWVHLIRTESMGRPRRSDRFLQVCVLRYRREQRGRNGTCWQSRGPYGNEGPRRCIPIKHWRETKGKERPLSHKEGQLQRLCTFRLSWSREGSGEGMDSLEGNEGEVAGLLDPEQQSPDEVKLWWDGSPSSSQRRTKEWSHCETHWSSSVEREQRA